MNCADVSCDYKCRERAIGTTLQHKSIRSARLNCLMQLCSQSCAFRSTFCKLCIYSMHNFTLQTLPWLPLSLALAHNPTQLFQDMSPDWIWYVSEPPLAHQKHFLRSVETSCLPSLFGGSSCCNPSSNHLVCTLRPWIQLRYLISMHASAMLWYKLLRCIEQHSAHTCE